MEKKKEVEDRKVVSMRSQSQKEDAIAAGGAVGGVAPSETEPRQSSSRNVPEEPRLRLSLRDELLKIVSTYLDSVEENVKNLLFVRVFDIDHPTKEEVEAVKSLLTGVRNGPHDGFLAIERDFLQVVDDWEDQKLLELAKKLSLEQDEKKTKKKR